MCRRIFLSLSRIFIPPVPSPFHKGDRDFSNALSLLIKTLAPFLVENIFISKPASVWISKFKIMVSFIQWRLFCPHSTEGILRAFSVIMLLRVSIHRLFLEIVFCWLYLWCYLVGPCAKFCSIFPERQFLRSE